LVFVREIEHGVAMLSRLHSQGVRAKFLKGGDEVYVQCDDGTSELQKDVLCGNQSKTLLDFESGAVPVLIGSSVLDEGVDIPSVEVGVNLVGGRSSIKTIQRLGRFLRPKPGAGSNVVYIIDFYDGHNKMLQRHSAERARQYRSQGYEVLGRGDLSREIERLFSGGIGDGREETKPYEDGGGAPAPPRQETLSFY
jgi:superfamily II DNA or RNA helicase